MRKGDTVPCGIKDEEEWNEVAATDSRLHRGTRGGMKVPQCEARRVVEHNRSVWQRFTERARKAVFYAMDEARRWGGNHVDPEHLLFGVLHQPDCNGFRILNELGATPSLIKAEVRKLMPRSDLTPAEEPVLTRRGKRVIDLAFEEARRIPNDYLGTEHLLLGLLREDNGTSATVMTRYQIDLETVRRCVHEIQS